MHRHAAVQGIQERFRRCAAWAGNSFGRWGAAVRAELWSLAVEKGLTIYFVDQPGFYQRAAYLENSQLPGTMPNGSFLSKCVANLRVICRGGRTSSRQ